MAEAAPPGSALAARCTACSTVFRVVPDQLRISEGWVRCGRCAQVFNAAENLIDLETGVPRRLEFSRARPSEPRLEPESQDAPPPAFAPPAPAPRPLAPAPEPPAPMPATENPDPPLEMAPPPPEPPSAPQPAALPAQPAEEPPREPPAAEPATPLPTPSFLREAERAARWRRPRVRAALAAGCLLLATLLLGQGLYAFRDEAAARVPALQAPLAAACAQLGCEIRPPRRLAELSVESSGLLQEPGTQGLYQLNVALRNRSLLPLAVPAVELSLTDAQGRLLSRRVLLPAELGASQPELAPGRDLALQARLQTGPTPKPGEAIPAVVGYTIELFYP